MVLKTLALKALAAKIIALTAVTAAVVTVVTVTYLRKEDIEEWFNSQDPEMLASPAHQAYVRQSRQKGSTGTYSCEMGVRERTTGRIIAGQAVEAYSLDPALQQIAWEFA